MWNKVKAALKAAKNAVIKAFRWITGTTVKAVGYSVMGISTVVAFIAAFRVAVILMLANIAIFGGAALVDAGTVITGDGPVEIGQTYEAFMFDDEDDVTPGKVIASGKDWKVIDEDGLGTTYARPGHARWVAKTGASKRLKEEKEIEVPEELNHHVHDVGIVKYSDGKVFIEESEAQKKEPVQAPFFADIRKALAEKGIEAKDTDFQPAIGSTGYLDRGDAKDLAPWTFGRDSEGREYVVTPWISVAYPDMDLHYGRVVIFQRYPSSAIIVQGHLDGYNVDMGLCDKDSFLAMVANGKNTFGDTTLAFVDDHPDLDWFGKAV